MSSKTLEICAFSIDSCIQAENNGANRIELCSSAHEGGTTPAYGLIKQACNTVSIPIVPIIRPRGGDFHYSNNEFEIMKHDITVAKELGCFGVALGILNKNNTIDIERTTTLVKLAHPMKVTFIRAFDLTTDPFQAMEDIIECGCDRILTSGLELKAENAVNLLNKLIQKANGRITIMPGSGINELNIKTLSEQIETTEFHASVRVIHNDETLNHFGFGNSISSNEKAIKKMRQILDNKE